MHQFGRFSEKGGVTYFISLRKRGAPKKEGVPSEMGGSSPGTNMHSLSDQLMCEVSVP